MAMEIYGRWASPEPREDRYQGPWRCRLCSVRCNTRKDAYEHALWCPGGLLTLVPHE